MTRRRKIWNRAPRNKLEAWIQDVRDRFNIGLLALFLAILVGGNWVWGRMNSFGPPMHPGLAGDLALPEQVRADNVDELRLALARERGASLPVGRAVMPIPGLGDEIAVLVLFKEGSEWDLSQTQADSLDRFIKGFAAKRETVFQTMVDDYAKQRAAVFETVTQADLDEYGSRLPELKTADEFAAAIEAPMLMVTPHERNGLAPLLLFFERPSLAKAVFLGDEPAPPDALPGDDELSGEDEP